ncbi:MAG TPA: hypothetical protein PKV31_10370 [Saprospiraceae bacterium]|nr:hypothetical protein [Anaerolineales bacterium]HNB93308.1 hypothetical protein [Saprospiraceae bacterium]
MKENDQSRFIRWGVPGWTMLLAFASFTLLDILLSPSSSKNSLVDVIKTIVAIISLNAAASAAAALLVAAAGIPLGFVIYQAYFYIRWNSPFSRDGFFPPFIVGRLNDLERTMEGVHKHFIVGDDKWRREWTNNPLYNSDHGLKWRYIENLFTEIVQYMDSKLSGLSLHVRYRYLMDLMHTLGAALFGIYLGYLGYILLKVKTDDISLSIILSISIVCLFFLMILLEMEDKVKKGKVKPVPKDKIHYLVVTPIKRFDLFQLSNPSANYLLFLFTLLYMGSPSPYTVTYTPSHFVFRIAVVVAVVLAWLIPKLAYPKRVIISEILTLAVLEILSVMASKYINDWSAFKPDWWNIGWCILFFLVTNMIFIKNRQNTRDDLIAMQNYTINRYFSNSIQPFEPPQKTSGIKRKTPKLKRRKK